MINLAKKYLYIHWDKIILILLMLSYIVILGTLSILRHNSFNSGFDLANMNQTVWNTLHGRFFSLSGDGYTISRFSIHADLILVFLAPFYLLWDDVRVLIIMESIFLALGAVPVYLLTKKLLKSKVISLALLLVYLLNPGMQWTDMYDFHAVALAIPLLLFSFYFAYTKNWRFYALSIFLALLTKEQISLTVALFGIFIFFFFKEKRVGLITFLVGISWFSIMVFGIIPLFSLQGKHWALSWYQYANLKTGQLETVPSAHTLLNRFYFAPDVVGYYISLLKPFAFLPLLGIPFIFLAIPELTVNVLSSHGQMRSIVFHYDSGITPWLVVSTIFAVYFLNLLFKKLSYTRKFQKFIMNGVVLGLVLVAFRVNYHYSPLPTTPSCWCYMYNVTKEDKEFEQLLRKTIPRNASITSSPEIRSHVTRRENSFTLPVATSSADFIAIIDQNRIVGNYEDKDFELRLIQTLNEEKRYSLVKHIGHFYLYRKNTAK